jgi:hypothetical protein
VSLAFHRARLYSNIIMSGHREAEHLAPRPDRSLSVHPAWREYPLIGAMPTRGKLIESEDELTEEPNLKQKKGLTGYNLKYAQELAEKYDQQKDKIAKASEVLQRLTEIEKTSMMQTALRKKKAEEMPSVEGLFLINSNGLHISPGANQEQREVCNNMLDQYFLKYGKNANDLS